MRKRVYLAGPISKGDLAKNIDQASSAFLRLAKAGLAPWCPQWSCFSGGCRTDGDYVFARATVAGHPSMSHDDWLQTDLAWVAVADVVLRLPGESKGADAEVAEAVKQGLPVFYSVPDVVTWAGLREAEDALCLNLSGSSSTFLPGAVLS